MIHRPEEEITTTSGLSFLWLELTSRCNLQCIHCYADSGPQRGGDDRLGQEDYLRLLKEGAELGCRAVQFIGGEPTIVPYLTTLIEAARAHGYEFIEVFTNGTRLSNDLLRSFRQHGVALAVSIYGTTASTHERVTKTRGSFQATKSGICRAIDLGIPVRAGIIAMQENEANVEATRAMLEGMGVNNVGVDAVREFGRGNQADSANSMDSLCGKCAQGSLAVSPDGKASPCIMSGKWAVGSVARRSLSSVVDSEKLRETRASMTTVFNERNAASACAPRCNPHCQPTCPPRCSPTCNPIACNPRGCWPAFSKTPAREKTLQ